MDIALYPAKKWNALAARVRAAWPYQGENARHRETGAGVISEAVPGNEFRHPWQVRCFYDLLPPGVARFEGEGEWRAGLWPGFVNGRDAFIDMPAGWPDDLAAGGPSQAVALTDATAPWLALRAFRDPAASSGFSLGDGGDLTYAKAEGYPRYFEGIGVKPAAPGGASADAPFDPARTRLIRACDIVLTKPRLGSAISVEELSVIADSQTHEISTTYNAAFYISSQGRAKLAATALYSPLEKQWIDSPFLGLPMNAGDPQIDQVKIATVYFVSPPDAGFEAVPDQTWQAYVKHDVFWNLWHATRVVPPATPPPPLKLVTGLGLGILDVLANAFIAPLNSGFSEATAFLQQADMRGRFWA